MKKLCIGLFALCILCACQGKVTYDQEQNTNTNVESTTIKINNEDNGIVIQGTLSNELIETMDKFEPYTHASTPHTTTLSGDKEQKTRTIEMNGDIITFYLFEDIAFLQKKDSYFFTTNEEVISSFTRICEAAPIPSEEKYDYIYIDKDYLFPKEVFTQTQSPCLISIDDYEWNLNTFIYPTQAIHLYDIENPGIVCVQGGQIIYTNVLRNESYIVNGIANVASIALHIDHEGNNVLYLILNDGTLKKLLLASHENYATGEVKPYTATVEDIPLENIFVTSLDYETKDDLSLVIIACGDYEQKQIINE